MLIQTKIQLLLIPLIIGPIIMGSYFGVSLLKDVISAHFFAEIDAFLEQSRSHTLQQIESMKANVKIFATSNIMEEYALENDEEIRYSLLQRPLLVEWKKYQQAYPSYYEIRYVLNNGYEDSRVSSLDVENRTEYEQDSPWFDAMSRQQNFPLVDVKVNPDTGRTVFYATYPVAPIDTSRIDHTNRKITKGYLVLTSSLDALHLRPLLETQTDNQQLFYMDTRGRIVRHPITQREGSQVAPALLTSIQQSITHDDFFDGNIEGLDGYVRAIAINEHLVLVNWISKQTFQYYTSTISYSQLLAAFLFLLLFIPLIVIFLRKVIFKRMSDLTRVLESVDFKADNNAFPINDDKNDELGKIARAFNRMYYRLERSHREIQHMAYHDSLTHLPNRAAMRAAMDMALNQAKRYQFKVAVYFIDLNKFKEINDTYGHEVGDQLLIEMAKRFSVCLRANTRSGQAEALDQVARLGGDEFVILSTHVNSVHEVERMAERLLKCFSETIWTRNVQLQPKGCIGIALYPDDGNTIDELLEHADHALYHAKESNENQVILFSPEMNDKLRESKKIQLAMKQALRERSFALHYQPIMDTETGMVANAEALFRWNNPYTNNIQQVIDIAESFGLIVNLGEWIIETALSTIAQWQHHSAAPVGLSINVSPLQFQYSHFFEYLIKRLEQFSIPASSITIELTETTVLKANKSVEKNFIELDNYGISFALDDFGTGYSSLGYLKKHPFSKLKIDRSYITNIEKNPRRLSVVRSIIELGHSLDLAIVAEGVENQQQADILRTCHCDYLQGFHFSKPIPSGALSDYIKASNQIENLLF